MFYNTDQGQNRGKKEGKFSFKKLRQACLRKQSPIVCNNYNHPLPSSLETQLLHCNTEAAAPLLPEPQNRTLEHSGSEASDLPVDTPSASGTGRPPLPTTGAKRRLPQSHGRPQRPTVGKLGREGKNARGGRKHVTQETQRTLSYSHATNDARASFPCWQKHPITDQEVFQGGNQFLATSWNILDRL